MAQQKLPVKDILAAIDMGAKNVWNELNDDERKQVSFWLLNRYVCSIKGCRDNHSENLGLAKRCIVTCGIFNLEIIILLVVLLLILFSNLL